MILIRYVDILETVPVEGGYMEKVSVNNATIPIIIETDLVGPIQPYFSKTGKLYKNVSYLTYNGDVYKVVGNYKELDKKIKEDSTNNRIKVTGYYDPEQREKKIEDRAKAKSKVKRRAKRSRKAIL